MLDAVDKPWSEPYVGGTSEIREWRALQDANWREEQVYMDNKEMWKDIRMCLLYIRIRNFIGETGSIYITTSPTSFEETTLRDDNFTRTDGNPSKPEPYGSSLGFSI